MSCAGCDGPLPAGAKFCPACGRAVNEQCAACGTALLVGARFCAECGAAAGPGTAPPLGVAKAPDRAPAAYTPKHLADRILQSRSALEGERKQVTVLFADVKGSMELAEQLAPTG